MRVNGTSMVMFVHCITYLCKVFGNISALLCFKCVHYTTKRLYESFAADIQPLLSKHSKKDTASILRQLLQTIL